MANSYFEALVGPWKGENILHNPMTGTPESSVTKFHNQLILNGTFLEASYDWVFENKKQEGRLTLGIREAKDELFATWIDTWHMNGDFLVLKGKRTGKSFELFGEYEIEGYPKWGWTISIQSSDKKLDIVMKNVSPEKQEYPAVDITLARP